MFSGGLLIKSVIAATGIPKLLFISFHPREDQPHGALKRQYPIPVMGNTQKCVDIRYALYGFAFRQAQNR